VDWEVRLCLLRRGYVFKVGSIFAQSFIALSQVAVDASIVNVLFALLRLEEHSVETQGLLDFLVSCTPVVDCHQLTVVLLVSLDLIRVELSCHLIE